MALADSVVDRKRYPRGRSGISDYLYSDAAQNIIARNFYRPSKPEVVDPAELKRFAGGEAHIDRRSALWRMGHGAAEAL